MGDSTAGSLAEAAAGHRILRDFRSDAAREERLRKMQETEDECYQAASQIVDAYLSFTEIDFDQQDPPAEWVSRFGEEGARRRLQIARLGWAPKEQMPGGVVIAHKFMDGVIKANVKRGGKKVINLNATISLPAPTSAEHPGEGQQYPVREIE